MNIVHLNPHYRTSAPCMATIGFFDGVHRGHQYVLRRLAEAAHEAQQTAVAITFDRHPMDVIAPERAPKRLCTTAMKWRWMEQTGVDAIVVLPFDKTMAQLSAAEFMQEVLKNQLAVSTLYLGYDNRFGLRQGETFADYVQMGAAQGIEIRGYEGARCEIRGARCEVRGANEAETEAISSTLIRRLVAEGKMEVAQACLGRAYTIGGTVVDGRKEGRLLGYPTANLALSERLQQLPADGVYAVKVRGCEVRGTRCENAIERGCEGRGARYEGAKVRGYEVRGLEGMMNIGLRPTFGPSERTVEVHLFDFNGSLYGEQLEVEVLTRVRSEQTFASPDQLQKQILNDKKTIEKYFQTLRNS